MKVVNNFRVIMAVKNIDNVAELVRMTGVSRNSINKLWRNDNVSSLRIDTLLPICEKLDVELLDLIEYIRDDSETK
ncbi:helix-turn-helix domain-containing protein [Priestia megaterium]|uniref:helix-turn-helix domain-containing protein n=1 Tax=Bacillaceae TaxID=186817 RepID=UPI002E1EA84B|nr:MULTISPECIES: helix-turn-helix domain-containing protein [Bacillaceae]MED1575442.1 helix-turn-helix domain-containing protein [Bacillus paranthracis]MED3831500.1 helix-turn-helix domain-containing protein [Priestia megaterium]